MSIIQKIISSTIVATFAFSALILPSKPVYAATPQGLIAYFGRIRTLIPELSGQHSGNIRTA